MKEVPMPDFSKIKAALANAGLLPEPIARLYAAAGIAPGNKIPLDKIDAGLSKMDLSIAKRMELKSTLHRLGIIAR
jgi:hypothetical protein